MDFFGSLVALEDSFESSLLNMAKESSVMSNKIKRTEQLSRYRVERESS